MVVVVVEEEEEEVAAEAAAAGGKSDGGKEDWTSGRFSGERKRERRSIVSPCFPSSGVQTSSCVGVCMCEWGGGASEN